MRELVIVDYGVGNLRNVYKAVEAAGGQPRVANRPDALTGAAGVILPGVGAFGDAAANLRAAGKGRTFDDALAEATSLLSGVSRGAGVVVTSKASKRLKHVEFVRLDATQALVVLVADDGSIENRILALPAGLPASALVEASNYLNARLKGRSLSELKREVADLSRRLKATSKATAKPAKSAADAPENGRKLRFQAKGLKSHREKLGLSAAEYGALAGVSAQSIYNWEAGKSTPRQTQVAALAELRGMGKREAAKRLEGAAAE